MPAVCTWTGSTGDGNLATAGNWLGGAAPVNGDDAVFDRGNYDVTAGLSPGTNLVNLKILPTYGGKWASTVTWGTITTAIIAGGGSVYNIGATSITTARVQANTGQSVVAASGTWTNTYVSGNGSGMFLCNGATLTNTYGTGVNGEFTSAAGAPTIVQWASGALKVGKTIPTFTSKGGVNITTTGTATFSTACYLAARDTYNHQSSGTIALLDLAPYSSFPCAGAFSNFTITALQTWPFSSINRFPPGITVTISGETSFGFQSPSMPGP